MGKSGVLEHKSGNISETHQAKGNVTTECYRNSPTLCQTAPSPSPDPLWPNLPQDWGFATPTQNSNRCDLRNG